MSTKQLPSHLTYVSPNGAQTVPGNGFNAAGRVLVFGDVLEVTPGFLEVVGLDWVKERLNSPKWLVGDLDANPEIRERRAQLDADERQRFDNYQKNGM